MRQEPPLPQELWEQIPPAAQGVLWVLIASYEQRIRAVEAEVAVLKEQLQQNSQNSSRPPSTDGPAVKRAPTAPAAGRKRGAQPGHGRSERAVVPLEEVKEVLPCKPLWCRRCGAAVHGSDAQPLRHQVFEVPPVAVEVSEDQLPRLGGQVPRFL